MDVKCERCSTEYEFDDALVSGRGTTVKCTNCGHKFKIRRSDGDFSEDFWNVTTGDGRTLVFTSLRELQRAIQGYLVERNDRLSRGGLPPKAIGQIPELAPFFEQREATKKGGQPAAQRTGRTQDGLGPHAAAAVASSAYSTTLGHPGPPPGTRPRQPTMPEFPAPPADQVKSTLLGTGPVSDEDALPRGASIPPPTPRAATPYTPRTDRAVVVPAAGNPPAAAPPPVPRRETASTVPSRRPPPPLVAPPPPPLVAPPPPPLVAPPAVSNAPPLPDRARAPSYPDDEAPMRAPEGASSARVTPPPVPVAARAVAPPAPEDLPLPEPTPTPRPHRSLLAELDGDDRTRDRSVRDLSPSVPDFPPAPRRRSVGGFIITAVVLASLGLLVAVWAQKNLGVTLGTKPAPTAAPAVDPRVTVFLSTGERALGDGNLELAKESFDKASALAEKDPHVLLGLARLAAVRADMLWLRSRLLPPDATDDLRITRDGLTELAAGARKASDDALAVAPEDPAAIRAKIDALRISGDRDGARALVGKITTGAASQPESAYVLAALDLAEAEPLWPTVLERLKVASSAESGPGRARAALVFALARSGDASGAKAEVERLAGMAKPHPLLPLLRGLADRTRTSGKLDAGIDGSAPSARDAGHAPAAAGGGAAGLPTDARELVAQGERARARGDFERARTLFAAAVERNPNDSEALTGLAAIAYAQRDLAAARTSYKRVLAINPNYMPALVGLADVEWDSGDKAGAARMYKDIVDRYPEGAYPGRIKQRVEGGGG